MPPNGGSGGTCTPSEYTRAVEAAGLREQMLRLEATLGTLERATVAVETRAAAAETRTLELDSENAGLHSDWLATQAAAQGVEDQIDTLDAEYTRRGPELDSVRAENAQILDSTEVVQLAISEIQAQITKLKGGV